MKYDKFSLKTETNKFFYCFRKRLVEMAFTKALTWIATPYHVLGTSPWKNKVQLDKMVPLGILDGKHIPPHSSIAWRLGYDEVGASVPGVSTVVVATVVVATEHEGFVIHLTPVQVATRQTAQLQGQLSIHVLVQFVHGPPAPLFFLL